jgi:predicted dehydrogenase
MTSTRWAVLGTGQIARTFHAALDGVSGMHVQAVASSDPGRARMFADQHGIPEAGHYDDVLAAVDAVYVATVHTTHADLAVRALRAGRPVLIEKPLALDAASTDRVLAAAESAGLPAVEAYKYRFTPFAEALHAVIRSGGIGAVRGLRAGFGFTAPTRTGRLFDSALAGGAVYDVGGYPASLAVAVARWSGVPLDALRVAEADGSLVRRTGVDKRTTATLTADGFTARIEAAITRTLSRSLVIEGEDGSILAEDGWGSRGVSARAFDIRRGSQVERVEVPVVNAFAAEAQALVDAAAAGRTEADAMPWQDSRATARLLDEWRSALGGTSR